MKRLAINVLTLAALVSSAGCASAQADATDDAPARLRELDAFWAEVSRAVNTGDFAAYKATCHDDGVLVSGIRRSTQPLSVALARWKKEFDATKAGTMRASVEFRFAQRFNDATTAHETGIFLYKQVDTLKHTDIAEYIHFESLLVKRDGRWQTMMEYQKSKATPEEWDALK
ncbi:MAG: hypothetical protein GC159_24360 [Phycisphaera sp.]|nr:hypothetical protein [Phycisphaera sp.]